MIPTMLVQPIVENAVKHGMNPYSMPLHISVRTRHSDAGTEVIVENDGNDFKPGNGTDQHITLKNIQQRLQMICEGSMTIMPRDGGGTVVKLTIP